MMQPTFIKTSHGFINLAQVEMAKGYRDGEFHIFPIDQSGAYKFTGQEAARLLTIFNTIAIFDATKEESK